MISNDANNHPFVDQPSRTVISLAIPLFFAMVAEPLTGLVDTAFVSRLGVPQLAALGVASIALSSLFWIFNFLGVSTQTQVAQAFGGGDPHRATHVTTLALLLSILFSTVVALIVWPFIVPIVRALGAVDAEVQEAARAYMRVRLFGAPALLITMTAFGALRGLQKMQLPMWIAITVNIINIALDGPLIFGWLGFPELGVVGAALASVIAQWVGAIWALVVTVRELGWARDLQFSEVTDLLSVGGDLFIRTGLLTLFLLLASRQANLISPASGAAHQAIRQVWLFTALGLDALALTGQSLVGYFVGASWAAQARRVARIVCWWSLGFGVVLALVMLLLQGVVAQQLVPALARSVFFPAWIVASLLQPINSFSFATDGVHMGTADFGYLRNAMMVSTAVGAIVLMALTTLIPQLWTVWVATAIWNAVRAAFGMARIWPGSEMAPLGHRLSAETD